MTWVFDPLTAILGIPVLAAALLVALPGYRLAATLNVVATFLTLLAAIALFFGRPQPSSYLLVDDLNNVFIVLTTFVGFTTSVFSASYIGHELEIGRLTPRFLRFYHAMYQMLMFAMNLALVANNIGVMWVAIELATLTTVLMVGIYRTHEALEAAWKYFILGSVGIALALLRFKMLLAVNTVALAPGPLMVTMGLVSLVFAAFMLYRRRDIKRMFAYSSIEHMGIITFAFGMGGPLANFAGLLHMTMHSLTKSAIFFAVGHIAQVKGTQRIADMGGLTETNPVLGWGLVLGVVAIAGLPPLGIFMSEFLVVTSTFARAPWLAIVLVFGILIGVAALFLRLNTIAFGEPRGPTAEARASYVPMFAHLALVFVAGIYMPPALVAWFQNVAKLLG
jgi:formate hydrogenlyase subunit 3/multisubunit Na+/H+ antiporter MnhD subunit